MPLLRFLRTVRHLRPVQIYGRLWRRVHHPRVDRRPSAPRRMLGGAWQASCERPSSQVDERTFRFLGITGAVRAAADWNDPARPRLWRYNAHYFDDLGADGAASRAPWHRALIAQWIAENPAPAGTGWEPYPTSLRIVNWVKWSVACAARGEDGVDEAARDSLATQVRWLSRRLEVHLLGNHLWANAKALVFAGTYFSGGEADAWLRTGLALLERELDEQILADGGHFERSPMYHAIVLEDVLDLVNLSRLAPGVLPPGLATRLAAAATRMHRWLRVMTHPDGRIALFNDAAFGIAPGEAALGAYAGRLGVTVDAGALAAVEALSASGYVRLQNARAVVICDVAPVGPDYLPGHAHADTLSFELSLDGRRVIVNSGTSTYEPGAERNRQRSTAAHNTVAVNGLDSSEVWGGFRVGRRARPREVRWGGAGPAVWVEGAHDGYRGATHRRRWLLEDQALTIDDRLAGKVHAAVAALHLHPDVVLDRTVSVSVAPPAEVSARASTWHPEFGRAEANVVLRVRLAGLSQAIRVCWA